MFTLEGIRLFVPALTDSRRAKKKKKIPTGRTNTHIIFQDLVVSREKAFHLQPANLSTCHDLTDGHTVR